MPNGAVNIACAEQFSGLEPGIEPFEHLLGGGTGICCSAQRNDIAMRDRLNTKPVLDHREMGVKFAKQVCNQPIIVKRDNQRFRHRKCGLCGQGRYGCAFAFYVSQL